MSFPDYQCLLCVTVLKKWAGDEADITKIKILAVLKVKVGSRRPIVIHPYDSVQVYLPHTKVL